MPTAMPCATRARRSLPPICYDKLGRKVATQMEKPLPSTKPSMQLAKKPYKPLNVCEKLYREGLMQQKPGFICGSTKKGNLPPGTVPPSAFRRPPGPVRQPIRRMGRGGEATYFHVLGRPWESKGFAKLAKEEVERMKASRPPTAEELLAEQEQLREEKRLNKEEEERVRGLYQQIDDERRERELEIQRQLDAEADDDDIEKAAEARRLIVLQKSLQARHEQDVRVQNAMRAIGAAKCSAMWTEQIEERATKQREQSEWEILQAQKDSAFNESKWGSLPEQEQQAYSKRLAFGAAVRQQINDNRQLRHIADNRLREESSQLRNAYDEYKRSQVEQAQVEGERKVRYRKELFHYIKLHKEFEHMMCEQEQRDEWRANKYIIEKEKQRLEQREQKAAVDEAKKRQREALYVIQQKILDAKDNREEMRLLAEQERLERKYRLQERQAVEAHRRQVEELRQGNIDAMMNINKLRTCYNKQRQREANELKQEFMKFEQEKQLEKLQKLDRKQSLYQGVTAQMEEHERARRRDVEQERMDCDRARALEEQRQKEIDMVISVKLDELASNQCLPHKAMLSLAGRVTHAKPPKLSALNQL